MTVFLETLANLMLEGVWLAPLIALLAGLITAFSPCCLASVPLIVGYVSGASEKTPKTAFKLTLTFALGMVLSSTALGLVVASAGMFIQRFIRMDYWYLLLGVFLVLMAFQIWGIVRLVPSTYLTSKNKKRGHIGAFITGTLAGIFSSPCSTPVLVALLTIVAQKGDILWGGMLLLLYSIGHSVLFIVAGVSTTGIKRIMRSDKYGKMSKVIEVVSGVVVLAFGTYLIYSGL